MISLAAPLTDEERSRVGQDRLSRWYQESTFTPRKACSSRAIAASSPRTVSLHSILSCAPGPTWSCCGSQRLIHRRADGGRPLLIEGREWYAALGSRYLCQNIEFERYFRKRPISDTCRPFMVSVQVDGSIAVARSGAA